MPTPDPQKLTELENRIARMKAATAPKPAKEEHYAMANMAWRMVIELVAGIAIGFGIGYGLDWLFGTLPIFLILFIGFGLCGRCAHDDANGPGSSKHAHGASRRRKRGLRPWQQKHMVKQKPASYFIRWINFR